MVVCVLCKCLFYDRSAVFTKLQLRLSPTELNSCGLAMLSTMVLGEI